MAISKVDYFGQTLIDLTKDTVTAASLLQGATAHDKAGNPIAGTASGPKPEQEKEITITENGDYPITPDVGKVLSKVLAKVNVSGGGGAPLYTATFTPAQDINVQSRYEIPHSLGKVPDFVAIFLHQKELAPVSKQVTSMVYSKLHGLYENDGGSGGYAVWALQIDRSRAEGKYQNTSAYKKDYGYSTNGFILEAHPDKIIIRTEIPFNAKGFVLPAGKEYRVVMGVTA